MSEQVVKFFKQAPETVLQQGSIEGMDPHGAAAELRKELEQCLERMAQLPERAALERAELSLEIAHLLLDLNQRDNAWKTAREAVDVLVDNERWEQAVDACEVLYKCDKELSVAALGMGVWLAVTYPIPAEMTVAMLHHIVDETPADSDGGAVAAMAAHYIADLRAPEGQERDNLLFFTSQGVGKVAKRHRGIEDEETLNVWIEMYDLNDPAVLIPRLGKIVDVMVGDNWWFDRDELRANLPR